MALSLLSYLLPDWREFTVAIALIGSLTALTAPFYPESPRFYYGQGRYEEGRKGLEEFAKKSKTELPEGYLDKFDQQMMKENDEKNKLGWQCGKF